MKGSPPPAETKAKVKAAYRAGIDSVRGIAAEHNVSEAWIRKVAKLEGWSRDLSSQVRARAEEIVRSHAQGMRTLEAVAENLAGATLTEQAAEAAAVETAAQQQAQAAMLQRTRTDRLFTLAETLIGEVEQSALSPDAREALVDALRGGDLDDAEIKCLTKAIADLGERGGRVDDLKKLVEAHAKLVGVQRLVLKMDEKAGGGDAMDVLDRMLADAAR